MFDIVSITGHILFRLVHSSVRHKVSIIGGRLFHLLTFVVGDHVLVKFVGGKRNTTSYRYACIIQALFDDNKIEVMSLKLLNNEDKTV